MMAHIVKTVDIHHDGSLYLEVRDYGVDPEPSADAKACECCKACEEKQSKRLSK